MNADYLAFTATALDASARLPEPLAEKMTASTAPARLRAMRQGTRSTARKDASRPATHRRRTAPPPTPHDALFKEDLRSLRLKFGKVPAKVVARVQAATNAELDRWTERVLTADSLAGVLDG